MKLNYFWALAPLFLFFNCAGNSDQPSDSATNQTDSTATVQQDAFCYGIDISKYQGDEVEYLEFNEDSLTFVICKATEGVSIVDTDFSTNWKTITEKGYIGGAYHFYRSNDNPTTQANFFLANFPDPGNKHLPMIIDVEGGGIASSSTPEQVTADVLTFLTVLEDARGRKPIIYTNYSTGNKYFTSAEFAQYPLWIADWSGNSEPTLPSAWDNWFIWQKTDSYVVNGKKNDFDVYNGNRAQLEAFLEKQ